MTAARSIDAFVDAGMLVHETGHLPEALELLAVRLDMAGAGDLLAAITSTCWGATDRHNECPHCGSQFKGTPNPHQPSRPPTPPPPPPPEK